MLKTRREVVKSTRTMRALQAKISRTVDVRVVQTGIVTGTARVAPATLAVPSVSVTQKDRDRDRESSRSLLTEAAGTVTGTAVIRIGIVIEHAIGADDCLFHECDRVVGI